MISFSEGQKNCLFSVLNVLIHISNESFLINCWNSNTTKLLAENKLSSNDICNTVVFNCREALNILEDNNFYDLAETDLGYWQEFSGLLREQTLNSLKAVANQIILFIENGDMDLMGLHLMNDVYWLEVVRLSKIAFRDLKEDLPVDESEFLW